MLILTRRPGEAILIDGGVRIVVLGTDGGGVRLGIEAPQSVGIVREEVVGRASDGNAAGQAAGARRETLGVPDDAPGGRESGEEDRGSPEE